MKKYIVYNANGDILRTGVCQDVDYTAQAGADEFIMEGVADDAVHRIENGMVVDKPLVTETLEELLRQLRQDRDHILSKSDWTQMPDSPLTATQKTAWADYRQALRDLPQNVGEITSLGEVVWPIPPN